MPDTVIFDVEYTAWEGSMQRRWSEPWEKREIVQIAATKVDSDWNEVESFSTLVKPKHNPELSAYFTNLTGITQEEVDREGKDFSEALAEFSEFCGDSPVYSYGRDETHLRENAEWHGLDVPDFPGGFHDIKPVLSASGIDTEVYTSGSVHQAVSLSLEGREHDALSDVRSVGGTVRELKQAGKLVLEERRG